MECYFSTLMENHAKDAKIYHVGRKDGGEVFECAYCGLVFVPKDSDPQGYQALYVDPGRYYAESVSIGYQSFPERFEHDRAIAEVRVKNLRRALDLVKVSGLSALDVGCGNCALTCLLQAEGFNASGVDLDAWSHKQSVAYGLIEDCIRSVNGDFIDYDDDAQFDVIMFTDSFEHFLYPISYAQKTERLLRAGGMAVLEMPDTDCEGWRTGGIRWRHVKPKEHPYLYHEGHIHCLFKKCKMEIERVIHTIPGRAVYYIRKPCK